jgi:CPA1 family monovalent cation:H+ antiporter
LRLTLFREGEWRKSPNWRVVATISFAGVRGAITLAGVLTLPLVMTDGSPFPARNLAIFLAMGVIIVSLIAATIALPLLLRALDVPGESALLAEEDMARAVAAQAAIDTIERAEHAMARGQDDADLYITAAARIMNTYRQRIEDHEGRPAYGKSQRKIERIERDFRLAALKAERTAIFQMARRGELGSEVTRKLVREIDLLEARYTG